jgi:hypothetical protein
MTATTIEQDVAERARRAALMADARGALAQGITVQERQARCESKADAWLTWFQREMAMRNCSDPDELLPDACARLEAIIEDRVAMAIRDMKAELRKALK